MKFKGKTWKVLNGVGVDGVSTHFPLFFSHFSPFSSLFSASPKGQGQTTAIYCKNGEFHSDPVCTDPVQNFPKEFSPCQESTREFRGDFGNLVSSFVSFSETSFSRKAVLTKYHLNRN